MTGRATHGHTRGRKYTPEYESWMAMMSRCYNPNRNRYNRYGGRGIQVCDRWHLFANFLADMGARPPGTSLDRFPNRDGHYEPGNCRWATQQQQVENSSHVVEITFDGETKTMKQWADHVGLAYTTLRKRIKQGWPLDKAFSIPASASNSRISLSTKERARHASV